MERPKADDFVQRKSCAVHFPGGALLARLVELFLSFSGLLLVDEDLDFSLGDVLHLYGGVLGFAEAKDGCSHRVAAFSRECRFARVEGHFKRLGHVANITNLGAVFTVVCPSFFWDCCRCRVCLNLRAVLPVLPRFSFSSLRRDISLNLLSFFHVLRALFVLQELGA